MKSLWTCLAVAVVLGAALCPFVYAGEIFPPPEGIEVLPLPLPAALKETLQ